jgi:hypothetical protein
MIEAKDPLAYENDNTPMIITIDANILSAVFVVITSPYPTVVTVYMHQ